MKWFLACPNRQPGLLQITIAEGVSHAGYGSPETLQQINFVKQYINRS